MGIEFVSMLMRALGALILVLGLMYLTFKISGQSLDKINKNKYVKVIDRAQIAKDNFIVVVKVGKKGYIMSATPNKTEKLEEISEEEILRIENNKIEEQKELNDKYQKVFNLIKLKFDTFKNKFRLKEDKYGK